MLSSGRSASPVCIVVPRAIRDVPVIVERRVLDAVRKATHNISHFRLVRKILYNLIAHSVVQRAGLVGVTFIIDAYDGRAATHDETVVNENDESIGLKRAMKLQKEIVKTSLRNVRPPKSGETYGEAIRSQREPIN